ncbi:MAG: L,D-transpeptidase family protein [Rhodomicrobium sp.]
MMHTRLTCVAAALILGGLALPAASPANARGRDAAEERFTSDHAPGKPLLAVIGLKEQRISVYDAKGKILEAPVSTGQTNYETPAGIYSIVQKEEEHRSNLYDDASMPYMERITWSGMALHAGALPGYPASHGCVRLPSDFAESLYDVTSLGMRVVVVRQDIAPADVPQPFMFGGKAAKDEGARDGVSATAYSPQSPAPRSLGVISAQKSAEAENAVRRVRDLRLGAVKRAKEATVAARAARAADDALAKAEAELKALENSLENASPEKIAEAEAARAEASAKIEAAQAQVAAAREEAKAKADAVSETQAEIKAADIGMAAAIKAAEEAKRNLLPVSVLISRKAQRLYIRKNNVPIFEAPVLFRDADKPIGTFIWTASESDGAGGMRWNMVSMYKNALNIEPNARAKQGSAIARHGHGLPADTAAAEAALKRLTLTDESIERISEAVLQGSSLIVTDELPSIETGKDTDFVVFMPADPQGALTIRAHHRDNDSRRARDGWDEDSGWFSSRSYRGRGGGWGDGGGFWGQY